jgi:hypothetical protein
LTALSDSLPTPSPSPFSSPTSAVSACRALQSLWGAPIKESDTAEENSILTSDPYSYTQATCTLRLFNTPTHILTRAHTRAPLQPAAMAFVSFGFVLVRVRVQSISKLTRPQLLSISPVICSMFSVSVHARLSLFHGRVYLEHPDEGRASQICLLSRGLCSALQPKESRTPNFSTCASSAIKHTIIKRAR